MQKTQRLLQTCGNSPEGLKYEIFYTHTATCIRGKKVFKTRARNFASLQREPEKCFVRGNVFDELKLAPRNQNFTKTDGDCPEGLDMNMDFFARALEKMFHARRIRQTAKKKSCNYARNLEPIFFCKTSGNSAEGLNMNMIFFCTPHASCTKLFACQMHRAQKLFLGSKLCIVHETFCMPDASHAKTFF